MCFVLSDLQMHNLAGVPVDDDDDAASVAAGVAAGVRRASGCCVHPAICECGLAARTHASITSGHLNQTKLRRHADVPMRAPRTARARRERVRTAGVRARPLNAEQKIHIIIC